MLKVKNRYFLLRHGENNYQIKKKDFIYPSGNPLSIKLTEKGIGQIKDAAQKLKKEDIALIYSSDFFRTRQAAEIVAKKLKIKKINFDKRLRDTNNGIYHSRTKKEFHEFVGYKKRKFSTKLPQGESWNDVKRRIADFIKNIDKKDKNKNILIVSHGDPLWLLEGVIKGLSKKQLLHQVFTTQNYIQVGELRKAN